MDYPEAIEYVLSLPDMERKKDGPGARVMTLDAMKRLLSLLGNPERDRGTIHITGSKGKGSTSLFIASILDAAGFSTALYTSPHLHDYTERICLNLEPVSREEFAAGICELKPVLEQVHKSDAGPLSTFGAINALFFHLARKHKVDWQIVEVGLGGAADGTNVFQSKEVAVITPVSLEHTAILGATTVEIARNKAGIITPGCTVVLSKQEDPAVVDVVKERCAEAGAQLVNVSEQYRIEKLGLATEHRFRLSGPLQVRELKLDMPGQHQMENAATACAVCDVLIGAGTRIASPAVAKGLLNVALPGRMEVVTKEPLVVLDGAHNGESMRVLARGLADEYPRRKWIIILGVNADKNLKEMLEALLLLDATVIATASASERAMPAAEVQEGCRLAGFECKIAESAAEAVTMAQSMYGRDGAICITGSLYLVGEARDALSDGHPQWQLRRTGADRLN